jgi:hypothetical protein
LVSKNTIIEISQTITLPLPLNGCETCLFTLKEEHRERILRKLFGQERDEMARGWRKLRNEELHYLSCSPNIIKLIKSMGMKWVSHTTLMDTRNT